MSPNAELTVVFGDLHENARVTLCNLGVTMGMRANQTRRRVFALDITKLTRKHVWV